LFVDHDDLLDFWSTAPASTSLSATIELGTNTDYYDFVLEYSDDANDQAVTLSYAIGGGSKTTIPTTALYYGEEVEGSPSTLTVKSGISCATNSYAYGAALTVLTAGVEGEFSIQAADDMSNVRDASGSVFLIQADLSGSSPVLGVADYVSSGVYTGAVTVTRSGDYLLSVELGDEGDDGLYGVYFASQDFASPSRVRIDRNFDINWGLSSPFDSGFGSDRFSVRWTGYYLADYSEEYTFFATGDDGVRLVVGETTLIDKLSSPNVEYSGTVSLTAGALFELMIEYKEVTGLAKLKVEVESGSLAKSVLAPENLFPTTEGVFGSHFSTTVHPAGVCGTTSIAFGDGVSSATAGSGASFTIQSRDVFHNDQDTGGEEWAVRLQRGDDSGVRPFVGSTTDGSDGSYTSTFTPTRAGSHGLHVSFVSGNGLRATYYNDLVLASRTSSEGLIVDDVDWSSSGTTAPSGSGLSVATTFSARYDGLYQPAVTTEITFLVDFIETDERVRLFVDDTTLIDYWTTEPSSTQLTATIAFASTSVYYPITMEYSEYSGSQGVTLQVEHSGGSASAISSSSLFVAEDVVGSPFTVSIDPAATCAASSLVSGNGLSISTSGIASTFDIVAMDAYDNLRNIGGDVVVVRAKPLNSFTAGGLMATYYENTDFSSAAGTTVSDLDFSTSSGTEPPSSSLASDNTFSAQYTGLLLAPATDATFRVTVDDGTEEFVTVSVDNKVVIDKWTATASSATGTYSFGLSEAYYDMAVDYKEDGTSSDHKLSLEIDTGSGFNAIPTTRLFYGGICRGTLTTDGGAGGDACTSASCAGDCTTVYGLVQDDDNGEYLAAYTPTKKGDYTVAASIAEAGSVVAEFFDTTTIGNTGANIVDVSTIGFTSTSSAPSGSGVTNLDGFSVRYEGLFRAEYAQTYSFTVSVDSSDERVKLWVDNSLIIDKWTTALTSQTATGTYSFGTPNGFYDIKLEYFEAGNDQAVSLLYETAVTGGGSVSQGSIPSTRLYKPLDVSGTTYTMEVKPSATCATTSVANGNALSIATAGTLSSFSITARDKNSNSKTDGGDTFTVSLVGSSGTPLLSGSVTDQTNGKYQVSYTPTIAKSYDLFARLGLSDISGSEFSVTVKPSTICGSKTTAAGTGLTSAITSTAAAFALQARDAYANAKSQGGSTFKVWVNPTDTTGSSVHGSVTDNSDGQYFCSYTVSNSGNYEVFSTLISGSGLSATYFSDASLSTAAYATTEDTVSWSSVVAAAQSAGVPTNAFSVRYRGALYPEGAVEYTMYVGIDGTDERVRLFVDNNLLIDKWSTAPASTLESATIAFAAANDYYEIVLEYSDATSTESLELSYKSTTTSDAVEVVASTRLFQTHDTLGAPYTMQTGN